ncbi:solute carrier family 45 member 4 isoform X2 [Gouania willdenowi]|uniref:Solute carrier family 45 member 4 n=1 Tax=Gouania willdenowi TaxID=441366 RepID=A0A8C5EHZ7_GOUWI|nr:solute carrier family 45 member 4 isoform X2 [Gouania willdenowi]
MPFAMPPQNTEADAMQVRSLVGGVNTKDSVACDMDEETGGGKTDGSGGKEGRAGEGQGGEESASDGSIEGIPLKRWVMHGAVMFGREFCYAMETALVTPVLLQIGLSLGDEQGRQPIGIVLTVLGVVVLDFCADATEGPIRAYLLDVADPDEQDMALNIHAASAGLGGAVGYALGGLDWTHTFLSAAFQSQEQILFFFAAILFSVSVVLHLFSIEEQHYSPQNDRLHQESPELGRVQPSINGRNGLLTPKLQMIGEDDTLESYDLYDPYGDDHSDHEDMDMDFLEMELVRSKSDSVLAMADSTLDHLDHDTFFLCHLEPSIFADRLSPYHSSPPLNAALLNTNRSASPSHLAPMRRSSSAGSQDLLRPQHNAHHSQAVPARISRLSAFLQEMENDDGQEALLNNQLDEQRTLNGRLMAGITDANAVGSNRLSSKGQAHRVGMVKAASTGAPMRQLRYRHIFYRQPSCTFSYYGRVGSHRYRHRRANAALLIKPSRSMNDLYEVEARQRRSSHRRNRHRSGNTNSSSGDTESESEVETTVRHLWLSMLKMPPELLRLCVCHLLTWFSIIAEAVFFTDFMGQVIYHGDPTAAINSTSLDNYHKGVQMGCWGLVIYAMTAATCSAILQKYLDNFDLSIKIIYIMGTLGFSIGTAVMAIFPNVYVSMVMISSMGIISMSISYCPYALLGQYHEMKGYIQHSPGNSRRGFGIDCAILSCQVYISQILVASALGAVVKAVGSVRVIPMVASGGSLLGFFTALFLVIYPTPNNGEGDSSKTNEKRTLKKVEDPNRAEGAAATRIEKPSFLKLDKDGKAKTTTTITCCHVENESAL